MKYRKKPIIVDAFKWTAGAETPEWISDGMRKNDMEVGSIRIYTDGVDTAMSIRDVNGKITANLGDYIMKYENGDISYLNAEDFEATYEKVEE